MEEEKVLNFQYFLYKLLEWFEEEKPGTDCNDISILKAMKLLFLTSIVSEDREESLLDVFDNFQAWRYGPVEADIYQEYSRLNGYFNFLTINRNTLVINDKVGLLGSNICKKNNIDTNINLLREENTELITYNAFRLVNISHYYSSWNFYHNILKEHFITMDPNIIRRDRKYFRENSLQSC